MYHNKIYFENTNKSNGGGTLADYYELKYSPVKHESFYFYNNYLDEIKKKLELDNITNYNSLMYNKIYDTGDVFKSPGGNRTESKNNIIKIGPYNNFKSAFSNNVINILNRIGITLVDDFNHIKIYDINNSFSYDEMLEGPIEQQEIHRTIKYPEYIEFNADDNVTKSKLTEFGVSFDEQEFQLYKDLFVNKLKRHPTMTELFDICQSNSEHSRHWFFKGKLLIGDNNTPVMEYKHLFDMVKSTLYDNNTNGNSIVAFNDNSSVIKGSYVNHHGEQVLKNIVLTAETHNFPSLICPFEGASTGIGGRIRDNHATGRGAYLGAGLAGYCVGDIDIYSDLQSSINKRKYGYLSPENILINASDGASDYGNKIGEPIIGGITRSFGLKYDEYHYYENHVNLIRNEKHIEWTKPIMFTAGIGTIDNLHNFKLEPEIGMTVVRLGGPAYKIGLGGGFSSSVDQDGTRDSFELNAVQRGDPQMGNKLNRVIEELINMGEMNPIISIHDQGAGGLANVVKEIVYPHGAEINLNNVTLGDNSLHPLEIWCSEFQESSVILCIPEDIDMIKNICLRENICCDVLGEITGSGNIVVDYTNQDGDTQNIVNLPLQPILEPEIQKEYKLHGPDDIKFKNNITPNYQLNELPQLINKILSQIDIGSKRFLTNKVDRSVTGLIAQQQCVGPFSTPLSNYSCISLSYTDKIGATTAIGERPYFGLINPEYQGYMSVGEMITNMMGSYVGNINNIKASVNWMWSAKTNEEKYKLYKCAKSVCYTMKALGISADGGKDSLSMSVVNRDFEPNTISKNNVIDAPGSVVITGYAQCLDITKNITPDLKEVGSGLIHIRFSEENNLCGSQLNLMDSILSTDIPENYDNGNMIKNCFNFIQELLYEEKILSLHDVSDGGLITAVIEMCISSGIGINFNITQYNFENTEEVYKYLFNEGLGVIIEVNKQNIDYITNELHDQNIYYDIIGYTSSEPYITFDNDGDSYNNDSDIGTVLSNLSLPLPELLKSWEQPSYQLEKLQAGLNCVESEFTELQKMNKPQYYLPYDVSLFCELPSPIRHLNTTSFNLNVAIIRDEGSNGDREMCAVFEYVGFTPINIHMNELLLDPELLRDMIGIVYVGGFSHSDVLGSAHGWYLSIKNNKHLQNELDIFYRREDTFSLGVCNGCQLMVKQNLFTKQDSDDNISNNENKFDKIKIINNESGRFESRYSTVKVLNNNNIFFKGMKDMIFGIWIAHGEGKMINTEILNDSQKVLAYVDTDGEQTSQYPYNPNGTLGGLTGIVSCNGRHLAMMPHPERSWLPWQLPYIPSEINNVICAKNEDYILKNSPWLMMFHNIYRWCIHNQ